MNKNIQEITVKNRAEFIIEKINLIPLTFEEERRVNDVLVNLIKSKINADKVVTKEFFDDIKERNFFYARRDIVIDLLDCEWTNKRNVDSD